MTIGLDLGEPSAAALTVAVAIEPLQTLLTDLSDAAGLAGGGFRGSAAAGLGAALTAWFEVAASLSPILDAYSQALATVDLEHTVNEGTQTERYDLMEQRLGGPR
jgi:HAMP domain-containing protein